MSLAMASCATVPGSGEPLQSAFGPTTLHKAADGYELRNRQWVVTIDPVTGGARLAHAGGVPTDLADWVLPTFEPLAHSAPADGYLESRDVETWQFFGQSRDGAVGWRIVYCLYYNQLNVTYLVTNQTHQPVTGYVQLHGGKDIAIQPFNEDPTLNHPTAGQPARGDPCTLQPGERINFATRWTLGK
jgi:hypothetical protein